jgi:hypothetical protein
MKVMFSVHHVRIPMMIYPLMGDINLDVLCKSSMGRVSQIAVILEFWSG